MTRPDLGDFGAVISEVNADGADRAANAEHHARHERESPAVRARHGSLSLETETMRELTLTNLTLGACPGFEPHALDFSLADCSEPGLLFAFRARTFCDLVLTLPRSRFTLSGEPFGRLGTLSLAPSLALERRVTFAFDAPALLAHE